MTISLKRKAIRGVAWSFVQRGGTQIASFIVFLALSRLLAPTAFGLVALATVYVALAQIFIDQGFTQAIIQRKVLEREHTDTAFWSAFAAGTAMTAVGIFSADYIGKLFGEPDLARVLRWTSLSILLIALSSTQRAHLSRQLAFGKLATQILIAEVVGGIVGIVLAMRGFGVWSLVARNLARDATATAVIWGISNWRPGFRISWRHFRQLSSFGANIIGDRALVFVHRNVDKLLIGYLLGTSVLGYYTIAFRLIQLLMGLMLDTFSSVAFPLFSRFQTDLLRIKEAFLQAAKYASLLSIPTFVGASILSQEIVLVLFGPTWREGIPVMQVLAMLGVLRTVTFFAAPLLLATGRPGVRLVLSGSRSVLGVLAVIIAYPWGIVAVAAALVLGDLVLLPFVLWVMHRVIGIDLRRLFLQLRPAVIAGVVMGAGVLSMKLFLGDDTPSIESLLTFTLAGIVIYAPSLYVLDPEGSRRALEIARMLLPARPVGIDGNQ